MLLTSSKAGRGRAKTRAVSLRSVTAEVRFRFQVSIYVRFVFGKVALWQVSVRVVVYPVGMISLVLYTYLYLHDTLSRTNRQNPGNLPNKNVLLEIGEHWMEKYSLETARG